MRRRGSPAHIVLIASILAAAPCAAAGLASPGPQTTRYATLPELRAGTVSDVVVHVGQRSVRALCTEGPREVVILHEESGHAESWRPVLERLQGGVGACVYERTGPLSAAPAPDGRGWYELEDDMRRIHGALGFSRPYVLVGHGVGGLYARLYAAERPSDVSVLVLVDPAHEDLPEAARMGMPEAKWLEWSARRHGPNTDGVREVELEERARRSRLPNIPVSVITPARRKNGDGWDARFLDEAARRVQASILRGVRSGRHIPAARSGHEVEADEPDLVAREIERAARTSVAERR